MSGLQLPGNIELGQMRLKDIAAQIEEKRGLETILVGSQNKRQIEARNEFIHIAYHTHEYTQQEIADYLGYKGHSTVNYYLNKKWHIHEKDS